MKRYFIPDDNETKTGASEDPPNDVTKQNKAGNDEKKKEEINVPDKALEHYKQSAEDTEE